MLALSAVPATSFSPLSMKDSTLNYVPPLYHPFPSVVDSFGNQLSARQAAYIETAAQRRARVEFLQKREGERRVENWVRAQIENSAFMVSVSVSASQQPSAAAAWSASKNLNLKSHRRDRHQILTSVDASHQHKPQIHFSDSDNAIHGLSYNPSHGLTSISEEEPYIFYSTPKPSLAAVSAQPLVQPKPHYSSFSYTSTPPNPPRTQSSLSSLSGLKKSSRSPRRHRRHQSDLESIPEDMEE